MRTTKFLHSQRIGRFAAGPELTFAATIFAAAGAWLGMAAVVQADLVVPLVATLLLVLAAGLALVAWHRGGEDRARVGYGDVAGALTLIGLCAAATIDPDQLVRVVAGDLPRP